MTETPPFSPNRAFCRTCVSSLTPQWKTSSWPETARPRSKVRVSIFNPPLAQWEPLFCSLFIFGISIILAMSQYYHIWKVFLARYFADVIGKLAHMRCSKARHLYLRFVKYGPQQLSRPNSLALFRRLPFCVNVGQKAWGFNTWKRSPTITSYLRKQPCRCSGLRSSGVRGEQKEIQMLTFISFGTGIRIIPWERK